MSRRQSLRGVGAGASQVAVGAAPAATDLPVTNAELDAIAGLLRMYEEVPARVQKDLRYGYRMDVLVGGKLFAVAKYRQDAMAAVKRLGTEDPLVKRLAKGEAEFRRAMLGLKDPDGVTQARLGEVKEAVSVAMDQPDRFRFWLKVRELVQRVTYSLRKTDKQLSLSREFARAVSISKDVEDTGPYVEDLLVRVAKPKALTSAWSAVRELKALGVETDANSALQDYLTYYGRYLTGRLGEQEGGLGKEQPDRFFRGDWVPSQWNRAMNDRIHQVQELLRAEYGTDMVGDWRSVPNSPVLGRSRLQEVVERYEEASKVASERQRLERRVRELLNEQEAAGAEVPLEQLAEETRKVRILADDGVRRIDPDAYLVDLRTRYAPPISPKPLGSKLVLRRVISLGTLAGALTEAAGGAAVDLWIRTGEAGRLVMAGWQPRVGGHRTVRLSRDELEAVNLAGWGASAERNRTYHVEIPAGASQDAVLRFLREASWWQQGIRRGERQVEVQYPWAIPLPGPVERTQSGPSAPLGTGLEEDEVVLEPGQAEYERIFSTDRTLLDILTGKDLADYISTLPEGTTVVLRVLPRNEDEAKELQQDWGLSPLSDGWGLVRELKAKPVLPKSLPEPEEGKESWVEVLEFTLNGGDVLRVVSPDSASFEGSPSLPAGFKGEVSRYHAGEVKKEEGLKWVGKVAQYLEQGLLEIRLEGVLYGLPGEASAKERFLKETGLPVARVLTEEEFEQRRLARASRESEQRRAEFQRNLLAERELIELVGRIKGLKEELDQRAGELFHPERKRVRLLQERIDLVSLESGVKRELLRGGEYGQIRGRILQGLQAEGQEIQKGIGALGNRGRRTGAPANLAAWRAAFTQKVASAEMGLDQYAKLAQEYVDAGQWGRLEPMAGMLGSISARAVYAGLGASDMEALDSLDRLVRRIHDLPDGAWPATSEEHEALSSWYSITVAMLMVSGHLSPETASIVAEDDWGLNEVWQLVSHLLMQPDLGAGETGKLGFEKLGKSHPQLARSGDKAWAVWNDALRVMLLPALYSSFRSSEVDRERWPEFLASFEVFLKRIMQHMPELEFIREEADGPESYPGFRRRLERVTFELGQHRPLVRDFLLRKEYAAVNLSGVFLAVSAWLAQWAQEEEIVARLQRQAEARYDLAQRLDPRAPVWRAQFAGLEESWVILEPGQPDYDRLFEPGKDLMEIFLGDDLGRTLRDLPEGTGVVLRVSPRTEQEAKELEEEWGLEPLRSGWDLVFRLKEKAVPPKVLSDAQGEQAGGNEWLEFALNGGDVLRVVSPDSATFEGSQNLPRGFRDEVDRYRAGRMKGPEALKWVGKIVQLVEQGKLRIGRLEGVSYGLPGDASAKGHFIEQTGLPADRILTEGELQQRRSDESSRKADLRRAEFTQALLSDLELSARLQAIKGLEAELDARSGELVRADGREVRQIRDSIHLAKLDSIVIGEVAAGGELDKIRQRVLDRLVKEEQEIRRGIARLSERGGPLAQHLDRVVSALAVGGRGPSAAPLKEMEDLTDRVMQRKLEVTDREWQRMKEALRLLAGRLEPSKALTEERMDAASWIGRAAFLLMLWGKMGDEEVNLLVELDSRQIFSLWTYISAVPWLLTRSDKGVWELKPPLGPRSEAPSVWKDALDVMGESKYPGSGGAALLMGVSKEAGEAELRRLAVQLFEETGPIPGDFDRRVLMRQEAAILNLHAAAQEIRAQASHRLGRTEQASRLQEEAERFYALAARGAEGGFTLWRPSFKQHVLLLKTALDRHVARTNEVLDARQWDKLDELSREMVRVSAGIMRGGISAAERDSLASMRRLVERVQSLPAEALPTVAAERASLESWHGDAVMILMLTGGQVTPELADSFIRQRRSVARALGVIGTILLSPDMDERTAALLGFNEIAARFPELLAPGQRKWEIWKNAATALLVARGVEAQQEIVTSLSGLFSVGEVYVYDPNQEGKLRRLEGGPEERVRQILAPAIGQALTPAIIRIAEGLTAHGDLQRDFLLRKEAAVVNLAAVMQEFEAQRAVARGDAEEAGRRQAEAERLYKFVTERIDPAYPVWRPGMAGLEETWVILEPGQPEYDRLFAPGRELLEIFAGDDLAQYLQGLPGGTGVVLRILPRSAAEARELETDWGLSPLESSWWKVSELKAHPVLPVKGEGEEGEWLEFGLGSGEVLRVVPRGAATFEGSAALPRGFRDELQRYLDGRMQKEDTLAWVRKVVQYLEQGLLEITPEIVPYGLPGEADAKGTFVAQSSLPAERILTEKELEERKRDRAAASALQKKREITQELVADAELLERVQGIRALTARLEKAAAELLKPDARQVREIRGAIEGVDLGRLVEAEAGAGGDREAVRGRLLERLKKQEAQILQGIASLAERGGPVAQYLQRLTPALRAQGWEAAVPVLKDLDPLSKEVMQGKLEVTDWEWQKLREALSAMVRKMGSGPELPGGDQAHVEDSIARVAFLLTLRKKMTGELADELLGQGTEEGAMLWLWMGTLMWNLDRAGSDKRIWELEAVQGLRVDSRLVWRAVLFLLEEATAPGAGGSPILDEVLKDVEEDTLSGLAAQLFEEMGPIPRHLRRGFLLREELSILNLYAVVQELQGRAAYRLGRYELARELLQAPERFHSLAESLGEAAKGVWRPSFQEEIPFPETELGWHLRIANELMDAGKWVRLGQLAGGLPYHQGRMMREDLSPADEAALVQLNETIRGIHAMPQEARPTRPQDSEGLGKWHSYAVTSLTFLGRLAPDVALSFQGYEKETGVVWMSFAKLLANKGIAEVAARRLGYGELTRKYPELKVEDPSELAAWVEAVGVLLVASAHEAKQAAAGEKWGESWKVLGELAESARALEPLLSQLDISGLAIPGASFRKRRSGQVLASLSRLLSEQLKQRPDLKGDFLLRKDAAVVNLSAVLFEFVAQVAGGLDVPEARAGWMRQAESRYRLIAEKIDPAYPIWRPDLTLPAAPPEPGAPEATPSGLEERLRGWLEEAARAETPAVVAIGPDRARQYAAALQAMAGVMPPALRERILLVTHTAAEAKQDWEPRGLFASSDTVLVAQELGRRFGAEGASRPIFYHGTRGQAEALSESLALWELEKRFQVVPREQSADLRQFLQELLAGLRGMTPEQLSRDVTFQQVVSEAELLVGA